MAMTFDEILAQILELLQREKRLSYRALKVQFALDDDHLEALKDEIIAAKQLAVDEKGRVLVWTGDSASAPPPAVTSTPTPVPVAAIPMHLAEKILTSRGALEGEGKQVTVLFADIKDSTELIRDLDPEAAQQLLDPALHIMMDAVHRYEGTVNQVLGDGIMALFGAPLAHEDHALRACYAALTTHLAARMEQMATPGTIRLTTATLRLVEGLVQVHELGPIPVRGMTEPVEVYELIGASTLRRRLQAAAVRGLTRFVGREAELAALQQALDQA